MNSCSIKAWFPLSRKNRKNRVVAVVATLATQATKSQIQDYWDFCDCDSCDSNNLMEIRLKNWGIVLPVFQQGVHLL